MSTSGAARAKRGADSTDEEGSPVPAASSSVPHADVYARLTTPFDVTFRDIRGGVDLEYITGEQAISRLSEVLGVAGWNFRVLEHGIHPEADEVWVLGEITATFPATNGPATNGPATDGPADGAAGPITVTRQQFGSQKIKRSRSSGTPLDIGFDLKGATTDALKKCASLLGVALYLWKKESPTSAEPGAGTSPIGLAGANGTPSSSSEPELLLCEECGEQLTETRFKDGTNWAPAQLAGFGRRKHSRVLCMAHYREANQAKRRAEEVLQTVPF